MRDTPDYTDNRKVVGLERHPYTARRKPISPSFGQKIAPAQKSQNITQKAVLRLVYNPPVIPLPLVYVKIGDAPPLLFVVDTGSNIDVNLSHWAVKHLHLETLPSGTQTKTTINDKNYPVYHFDKPLKMVVLSAPGELSVDHSYSEVAVAVNDQELTDRAFGTPRIAGTLGLGFWGPNTLQFDFDRKTLSVFIDSAEASGPQNATKQERPNFAEKATALVSRHLPGFAPIPQVNVSVTGKETIPSRLSAMVRPKTVTSTSMSNSASNSVWLILDTGSNQTTLPETLRLAAGIPAVMQADALQYGKQFSNQKSILPRLTLTGRESNADVEIKNVVANWYSTTNGSAAVLGMDVLSRYRVTLNASRDQVYLETIVEKSDYSNGSNYNCFCGLYFQQNKEGKFIVTSKDSILQDVAITSGDEIVEIDAYPLSNLSFFQARWIADNDAGSVACFMIRHKESPNIVAVWFVRPDYYLPSNRDAYSDRKSPLPSFRLQSRYTCQVTFQDGRTQFLRFHCNPDDTPPPLDEPGIYYQRLGFQNGRSAWGIISPR